MRFSMLHLSDLHRDNTEGISNAWLMESLVRDAEQYEGQGVAHASLCLVTGDLIFGAGPGTEKPLDEVQRQYRETEEFLVAIADRLFGGQRERVVILPGNHDMLHAGCLESMTKIDAPLSSVHRLQLAAELRAPHSALRWSWSELSYYRVANQAKYRERLQPFAEFYARFYDGQRQYSLDPPAQFALFEFRDLGFCILALNSCHDNDPLRRSGSIHPDCLAEGTRSLRHASRSGWISAAAWHHNLSGPPTADDYLDTQVLQLLIDSGVSLAFHGHQHRQDCIDERFRLGPEPRKITVISAGTLCSNVRHLAAGTPRSYNVVEIDTAALKGTVHVRQMLNAPPAMPIWGAGYVIATNSDHIDFQLCGPLATRSVNLDTRLQLEAAARLVGERKWAEAAAHLAPLLADDMARPLMLKALSELGDVDLIQTLLFPPRSTSEAVEMGGSILSGGHRRHAEVFLATPFVRDSTDASVRDIGRRVRERVLR